MTRIEFKPKEAEVLRHRIEIPDAMADVFDPYLGDGNNWGLEDHDKIEERITEILSEIFTDGPRGSLILVIDLANEDHVAVVSEVVEGSTMPSIAQDLAAFDYREPEYRQGRAWLAAIERVEEKLNAAGINAKFAGG